MATCDGWTDSIPARNTSATYAPYDSTSATQAQPEQRRRHALQAAAPAPRSRSAKITQDRRQPAEQVGVGDGRDAAPAPARACAAIRASATASASTRISGSAIRNSLMFSQNPLRTTGNAALASSQVEERLLDPGPARRADRGTAPPAPNSHAPRRPWRSAADRARRRRAAGEALALRRALGCQSARARRYVGRLWQHGHVARRRTATCCSSSASVPSVASVVQRLVDARRRARCPSRTASRTAPCSSGLRLELPDDRRRGDLHRRDVERGRQVGQDRVDLAVEQRLLGGVGVLEDQRVLRRLDDVADRGERGRAGLRAEVESA